MKPTEAPSWIDRLNYNMCRFGLVYALAQVRWKGGPIQFEALSRIVSKVLSAKVRFEALSPTRRTALLGYIRARKLDGENKTYAKDFVKDEQGQKRIRDVRTFEPFLEDVFLSDEALPSQSGGVTPASAFELVNWGLALHTLRPSSHVLTQYGQTMASLNPEPDKPFGFRSPDFDRNPFLLGTRQRLYAWRVLLLSDGGVLVPFLDHLAGTQAEFDVREGGNMLIEALDSLLQELRAGGATSKRLEEARRLGNLISTLKQYQARGSDSTYTKATKEMRAAPRLEQLVDLGLLDKPASKKTQYQYAASETTRLLSRVLSESWSGRVGEFLEHDFFRSMTTVLGLRVTKISDTDRIFALLCNHYPKTADTQGTANVEETAAAASALAIETGTGYFEIAEARSALEEIRATQGGIRFEIDKLGGLSRFSVRPDILKKYLGT